MKILGPISPSENDLNNSSIVAKLTYGSISFLFTGDAEKELEAQMIRSGLDLTADILKVATTKAAPPPPPVFYKR